MPTAGPYRPPRYNRIRPRYRQGGLAPPRYGQSRAPMPKYGMPQPRGPGVLARIIDLTKQRRILIAGFAAAIIILFIFVVPLPYKGTEYYNESEPYTDYETYYEEGVAFTQDCGMRAPEFRRQTESSWINDTYARVGCVLTNFEKVPAVFNYEVTADYVEDYMQDKAKFRYGPFNGTVKALSTETFYADFNISSTKYWYNCVVVPYDIRDCKLAPQPKPIKRQREVTKERDVQKERETWKWKPLFFRWID
jgi:hypothetical protein